MALIKIQDLTYYYPEAGRPSLEGMSIEIPQGQFVLLTGGSGSGKSTLIRVLAGLIPDFYGGTWQGAVYLGENDITGLDRLTLTRQVGVVFQDPESQLVMTGVEHELAFGLENLGLPNPSMRRRVREAASALGLSGEICRSISELSGGQKQKVALAAVMAMQPRILLLDEPTSQLDPIAAEEILAAVKRLNEENSLTVILAEQRLERCFHLADRVLILEEGKVMADGPPGEVARWVVDRGRPWVPPLAGLFAGAGWRELPLTVKEGRDLLQSGDHLPAGSDFPTPALYQEKVGAGLVDLQDLWFTYPNGKEALKGVNLQVRAGEITVLMGENAAGKTTLLKIINGLLKPSRGKARVLGRDTGSLEVEDLVPQVGYLSQEPRDYLFLPTVEEELALTLKNCALPDEGRSAAILEQLELTRLARSNPRDVSVGERQRIALAAVMVAGPQILLLDEPTRGLDYQLKAGMGGLLSQFRAEGRAVVVVTHDVEFAAQYADRIVLMADGELIAEGSKYEILADGIYYSPQIARLLRDIAPGTVTPDQGKKVLRRIAEVRRERA